MYDVALDLLGTGKRVLHREHDDRLHLVDTASASYFAKMCAAKGCGAVERLLPVVGDLVPLPDEEGCLSLRFIGNLNVR